VIVAIYRATVHLHHVLTPGAKSRGWDAFRESESDSIPDAVEPRIVYVGEHYSFEPLTSFSVLRESGSMVEVVAGQDPIGWVKTPPLYRLEEYYFEDGCTLWGGRLEPLTVICLIAPEPGSFFAARAAWHDATHDRNRFQPAENPVQASVESLSIEVVTADPPADVIVLIYESTEQCVRGGELVRRRQRVEFSPIEESIDESFPGDDSWDLTTACHRATYSVIAPPGVTVDGEWLTLIDGKRATASLVRDWAARGERGFALAADSELPATVDRRRQAEAMRYPPGRVPAGTPKLQAMLF
jgi:hypothetical protein